MIAGIGILFRFSVTMAVVLYSLFSSVVYATPKVVASLAPVHSLLSAVMLDVAKPILLISGGQSPHASSLKPSEMRALAHADLIVSVSPEFEISLRKTLSQPNRARQMTLSKLPQLDILRARSSGLWDSDHRSHRHAPDHDDALEEVGYPDFHIWLSTENARVIVNSLKNELIEIDPENALLYQRNAGRTIERIATTQREIADSLRAVQNVPYLVFHDAYQYFEREFGLNPVGAVTLSPEQTPGVKTLLSIRQSIEERGAKCIFHEPQFQPRLVSRIAEESGIYSGELDPIGASMKPGPGLWFELMFALRDSLLQCLQK